MRIDRPPNTRNAATRCALAFVIIHLKEAIMRKMFIPSIAGIALLGSATLAVAQGHGHHGGLGGGGGGMRGPSGGGMHAPGGGGGGIRMGPSGGGRSEIRVPRAYSAPRTSRSQTSHERSGRAERPVHRGEAPRNAQSRRTTADRQRAQHEVGRNKQVERNTERNR